MDDNRLFDVIRKDLFTAVIGDVLDAMGHRSQFLPQPIKPLVAGTRIVGRAMPVLEADYLTGSGAGPLADRQFGVMFDALDSLRPGEIYMASGASPDYALWGGLMSARARHLGAAGAILDGYVRDTGEIRKLGLATFCRGSFAQDQGVRGKVVDFRLPVCFGNALVTPGDLIFGDDEGVLVIPQSVEREAVEAALAKVSVESEVAAAIKGGMSTVEAFRKFGVM